MFQVRFSHSGAVGHVSNTSGGRKRETFKKHHSLRLGGFTGGLSFLPLQHAANVHEYHGSPHFAASFAAHKHSHITAPTTPTHKRVILQSLLRGQPLQNSTPQTSREAPHKEPRNTGRCERTMGWLRFVGSFKSQVSFAKYSLFYRAPL